MINVIRTIFVKKYSFLDSFLFLIGCPKAPPFFPNYKFTFSSFTLKNLTNQKSIQRAWWNLKSTGISNLHIFNALVLDTPTLENSSAISADLHNFNALV